MQKSQGITENCWSSLTEDKRIAWKYFSRLVAIVASFFVTKTGNAYFDWAVFAITAIFFLIVIETQRSYSKITPQFRKQSIRVAIFLGSWSVAVFGIAIFAQVALVAVVGVLSTEVTPILNQNSNAGVKLVVWSSFLVAMYISIIRTFRELRFEELIYDLPRNGLKHLLIYKQPKATTFALFAFMELSTLLVCLFYSSSVAEIAKVIIKLCQSSPI